MRPDYIVIGAGSAGCLVAAGLTEGGKNTVLLLETGPTDRHPLVKIPLGYGLLLNDETRNYRYKSAPEPNLHGREIYLPRGRTVGGSGSINAMVYCRGMPQDYESWKETGLDRWGWDDVRAAFEANESPTARGGVSITDPVDERHPFTRYFRDATAELGIAYTDDFNGETPEGAGYYRITTRNGFRHTSADAFLRPALRNGGLRLVCGATVRRLLFEGRKAVGVRYVKNAKDREVHAAKAVIVCAGAINSPQILQISGIGDPEHLANLGVDAVLENANVGANLQDHFTLAYYFRARVPTLNSKLSSLPARIRQAVRYALTRRGPLSVSVNQYGGFIRTSPDLPAPDQQLYFNAASYSIARARGGRPFVQADSFPGFSLCYQPTRPTSRGRISAVSADVAVPPRIELNALDTEKDRQDAVNGGRFIARVVQTKALQPVIDRPLLVSPDQLSDEEILEDFRERCGTTFHQCGSCAMGNNPSTSVVDSELRVHGVDGLYVVDASVFPSVPSGNINAPALMVARRGVDFILKHQSSRTMA